MFLISFLAVLLVSHPHVSHPPSLRPRRVPSPRDSQASSSCCFIFVPYVLPLLIHHLVVSASALISLLFFLKKEREKTPLRIASALFCLLPFAHGRVRITSSTRPAASLLHEHRPLSAAPWNSDHTALASAQRTTDRLQESHGKPAPISHDRGKTRTRAVILTLSHLGKLEQRYETFGVMCRPGLVFAGSDYTVLTSQSRSTAIAPSAGLRTRI